MIPPGSRVLLAAATIAMASACSFHSVATHWNGRVGPDGHPVFVRRVTNVGLNLAVILPILGKITIDEMIDESTEKIAALGSDHVRVIESSSENYWYGFPPFTWVLTPVITEVSVEYRPSEAEIAEVEAADATAKQRAAERREQDTSHTLPDPDKLR